MPEEVVLEEVVSVSEFMGGFTDSDSVLGFTDSDSVLGFTDSDSVLGFTDSDSVLGFTVSMSALGCSDVVENEIIPTTSTRTINLLTIKLFIS